MEDLGKPSIPEFEKIDAKKLYEALETIAELEKKWDESEKRTRDLAEVERPEVVGYRSAASRMVYEKDYGLQNPEPMMLVSQHDRIVGELLTALASMTEARNRYNNLWNCAGNRLALAQVEIRKVTSERYAALARIAELEKELAESEKRGSELAASYCDGVIGDEHGHPYCRYKVERDAALAEVERLRESKCDPSGSFDRCMKMMYERDENAKQLEVALARVAELEKELAMARDAAAKGDTARHAAGGMEMEIHELKMKLAELEKQEPVAWGAFHFGGKRDGKLYTQCETEAQIEAYILDMHRSSDSLTLRKGSLYTAPVVQAQPSVPDGWKPVPMEPTPQMTFVGQSLRYDSVNSIGEIYRQMLAVAPSPIDPAAHPQPCQQPQAHPARCGCER
ncbi:hypothetical protein NP883_00090 [Pseudomonas phage Kara-mokiny_kep-wari_Wadjak_1]|nr:hypothetical protein NP883_00090 [Pseudomonas phage Kara-mokiny_kep-wari_Wadjak_1]UXD81760.1 hypothetical protein NP883_00076 [Pseudomonas phage Kara-mokiny_kep-wari_Wadjak_2]UXD82536.1 hypothetical protein NP274_00024 [Pseudomonas phage Kara-mokiny kep-wari Wadjak 11]